MVFNVSKHYDVVLIGKQGENLARTIQFDFSPWQADYGDGTVSILNKRNTDSSPYPVTLTTEGTIATWKPTSSDTQYAGAGFCEVVYTVNGIIAKSATFNTYTTPALGQSTTPPAPYQAWVDQVLEAKDDAIEAAEDAEEAKEAIEDMSATASVDSSVGTPSVTVTKTTISGHENLDFAFSNIKGAKGDTGEKGDKGDTGEKGDKGDKGDAGSYTADKGISLKNDKIKARIGSGLKYVLNLEDVDPGYDLAVNTNVIQPKITSSNKLDYSLLANTPTIPTKTSDLDNDSGFITSAYHDASKQNVLTAGAGLGINSDVISVNCGDGLMSANHILKVKAGEGIGFAQNGSLKVALGDNTIINTVDGLKVDKTVMQAKSDNSLTTTAKTVVGAINELDSEVSSHSTEIANKENTSNKVTSISSSSNDAQYPSAKAVYTFIQSLDGNGVAY